MKSDTTKELTLAEKRELAASEYFDRQVALFNEVNSKAIGAGRKPPFDDVNVAASNNIIVKRPDGTYSVRKRERPFSVFDCGDGVNSGGFGNRSFSDRMMGKQQYTADETKLLLSGQMITGLEIGEVAAAGSSCM